MKIEFIPISKFAEDILTPPVPAKTILPDWYKDMPFLNPNNTSYNFSETEAPPTTLKGCMPFLDALTAGYVCLLAADIEIIKQGNNLYSFYWRTKNDIITTHTPDQHPNLPGAFEGQSSVFKFFNEFIIKTPKGYSTYFTHPMNRHDLPFRTFTGVVDTDSYMAAVQFPAQLLNLDDDITILERGTPICQFIPFKRDSWKSTVSKYDDQKVRKANYDFFSKIYRAYKTMHWTRKNYR